MSNPDGSGGKKKDLADALADGADLGDMIAAATLEPPTTPSDLAELADSGVDLVADILAQVQIAQDVTAQAQILGAITADEIARRRINAAFLHRWQKVTAAFATLKTYRGLRPAVDALDKALAKDREDTPRPHGDDEIPAHWPQGLRLKDGKPLPTLRNIGLILAGDPHWQGALRWNSHATRVEVRGSAIEDRDETGATMWLEKHYGIAPSSRKVGEAMHYVAHQTAYNPIRDYLEQLTWDGTKRIDRLAIDYLGGNHHPVVRAICRRFMISAVARIYQPGCKVDTALVLQGPQGVGKSTAIRILASDAYFSDTEVDLRSKDAFQQLQGVWLYEMAEMAGVSRADVNRVKGFISSPSDRFRLPYGRNIVALKRQCVFVCTTNDPAFLTDPTGARRFWPLEVRHVARAALIRDRDQLWAEAVHAYKAGEQWHMTDAEDAMLRKSHGRYQQADPVEDFLHEWLGQRTRVQLKYPAIRAALHEARVMGSDRNITNALRRLGWRSKRSSSERWWAFEGGG